MTDSRITEGAKLYRERIDTVFDRVHKEALATNFSSLFWESITAGYAGFEWKGDSDLAGITHAQHTTLYDCVTEGLRQGDLYHGYDSKANIARLVWGHGEPYIRILPSSSLFHKEFGGDRVVIMHQENNVGRV